MLREDLTANIDLANIFVWGGTYNELLEFAPELDILDCGLTQTYGSIEGYYQYGSTFKIGHDLTESWCYIVYNRSPDNYVGTVTHELGHALGWDGHSPNSSDLMYFEENGVSSLTDRDKNHLAQIY